VKKTTKKAAGTADRGGVQSVTIAAKILKSLAASGSMPLKDIAAATGLPRAKVHRYLVSLRSTGMVTQDAQSGRYQIGSTAIAIGLTGLRRINPIAEVCAALPALRDRIGQTVTAAIWSEIGPVVIAMHESDHWLTMNVRIGSALPLTTTAIGRTFLANLPPSVTASLVAAELKSTGGASDADLDALLAEIRLRRLARAPSAMLPGVDAIAAPVFDYRNNLVAVICVVARAEANITGWDGSAVRALTETAQGLSAMLGHLANADSEVTPKGETAVTRSSPRRQGPRAKKFPLSRE
jgi:DNA-binding IclR family transcriptional regulator